MLERRQFLSRMIAFVGIGGAATLNKTAKAINNKVEPEITIPTKDSHPWMTSPYSIKENLIQNQKEYEYFKEYSSFLEFIQSNSLFEKELSKENIKILSIIMFECPVGDIMRIWGYVTSRFPDNGIRIHQFVHEDGPYKRYSPSGRMAALHLHELSYYSTEIIKDSWLHA